LHLNIGIIGGTVNSFAQNVSPSGQRRLSDRNSDTLKLFESLHAHVSFCAEYVGRILHPAAAVFYSCGGEI